MRKALLRMVMKMPKPAVGISQKYLSPQHLRVLKNLFFAARVIVEGNYAGRHKSPYKGSAQEFTDYREYCPGDEIRIIDWKAYARTDRYIIKLFEKETDMQCYVMLDSSASMGFGGHEYDHLFPRPELSKYEYACYLAAALSYLAIKQGDKVGLTLFDRDIKTHIAPGGTFSHLYRMLNLLEWNKVGSQTSISRVLRETFPLLKRKGLLILISDLLDDPEDIFNALSMYAHEKFEIILFHVLHRYELSLPSLPSVNFIDSETGEQITSVPTDIRESYQEEIQTFLDRITSLSRSRRIDYQFLNTQTPYYIALQKYIQRRAR